MARRNPLRQRSYTFAQTNPPTHFSLAERRRTIHLLRRSYRKPAADGRGFSFVDLAHDALGASVNPSHGQVVAETPRVSCKHAFFPFLAVIPIGYISQII